MRILTINCGSSSVKFALLDTSRAAIARKDDRFLARGVIERVGTSAGILRVEVEGSPSARRVAQAADHRAAIRLLLQELSELSHVGIDAVAHRIVHGGPTMSRTRILDAEVEHAIEEAVDLAPLHNPHNLAGIRALRDLLPGVPQVVAFDTGFHQTIPPAAAAYALPRDLCAKHGLRRYGFHGLSHRYVVYRIEALLGRDRRDLRILSIHLGNGCSITAVDGGRSVETSMGFTPAEGLVMGTRPGDVDAGALFHLMHRENLTIGEIETILQRRSGLAGLSGGSNDLREIFAARSAGNEAAALAIDVFVHRLKKYIGAYAAVLGRVDAIGFTGGIGENIPEIRARALDGLAPWGVAVDAGANEEAGGVEARISSPYPSGGGVAIWVIPSNEELILARDAVRCVEDARRTAA